MKPNTENTVQTPIKEEPAENLTSEKVYQGLNDFNDNFEISPEKLKITYPKNDAKAVFKEISDLIEGEKVTGEKIGETEEEKGVAGEKTAETAGNPKSPADKLREKMAEIKDSGIKDYRIEAFANCALGVFENETEQENKSVLLNKLTEAFSFLGQDEEKEQAKQIGQLTQALQKITSDTEIGENFKLVFASSIRDAFTEKKESKLINNSIESEISAPESNSEDKEKDKDKDKEKDEDKDKQHDHFLDNYDVNFGSVGAGAAKLAVAVSLCFVPPPGIGILLAAAFCLVTPNWGQHSLAKKKERGEGNILENGDGSEKEVIEQGIGEAINSVSKEIENNKGSKNEVVESQSVTTNKPNTEIEESQKVKSDNLIGLVATEETNVGGALKTFIEANSDQLDEKTSVLESVSNDLKSVNKQQPIAESKITESK